MYYDFYQLKENPFNITADPDFFYCSKSHSETISHLLYGIEQRKGIIVITGEVGTGKTTLCRSLLKQANPNHKFALILNPSLSDSELLQAIVNDLGILPEVPTNKTRLLDSLNQFLLSTTEQGQNVILIIDEAQSLEADQLEQIRLLSNLETEKEKLLQIILVGQPELASKLQQANLRSLHQRVAVLCELKPLEKSDIENYIAHRLTQALYSLKNKNQANFTKEAMDAVYHYTKGYPRAINLLCDRALLAGFVAGTYTISRSLIEKSAKEILSLHQLSKPMVVGQQKSNALPLYGEVYASDGELIKKPSRAAQNSPRWFTSAILAGVIMATAILCFPDKHRDNPVPTFADSHSATADKAAISII